MLQKRRISRTWSRFFSQYQKRGVYIYGSVGRGKTTLCQIFFDELEIDLKKHKVHYDQFMHELLKDQSLSSYEDAYEKYRDFDVLWIDELQIYDIASAMLLKRAIPELLNAGVFIMMSGNIEPINFYKDGMNRENFSGFIPYFYENFDCIHLKGEKDFRFDVFDKNKQFNSRKFYQTDFSSKVLWNTYFLNLQMQPKILYCDKREWKLTNTFEESVYITFDELVSEKRGTCDYRTLVQSCEKIYIENLVPMDDQKKDWARRLMTFVDNVYEYKRELYISSLVSIDQFFQVQYSDISYDRTISRLVELLS